MALVTVQRHLLLLFDVFVGFHSPHGWEVLLAGICDISEYQKITTFRFVYYVSSNFRYYIQVLDFPVLESNLAFSGRHLPQYEWVKSSWWRDQLGLKVNGRKP